MNSTDSTIKSGPKDVFTHLLAIITLYISAISFSALIFQYIDRFFPDPLVDIYAYPSGAIRWAIASLVIIFPVYVWLSWTLRRDDTRNPEKRELKIRKWLLYFTLFAASAVIIGDLIALIYNFLGGDLSARFVLKVSTVLFVALAIFGYYLWNLKSEQMAVSDPRMRWFVFFVAAIVMAATIGGFFIVGSPFQERMRRFDQRRTEDLQSMQWQIVSYWQRKEKLPENLNQLRDDISGFLPPSDPETSIPYEYLVLRPLKFELCATFKTINNIGPAMGLKPIGLGMEAQNWKHGAERTCFERAIDPELYRLDKPAR